MTMDRQLEHHEHNNRPANKRRLSFLLHDIESPSNVGALFRCADALGCEHIYLSGTTPAPPNRKLRKSSRAAELYVNYSQHQHYQEVLDELSRNNCLSLALELSLNSVDLESYANQLNSEAFCIVPGSENHGLKDELLNACNQAIYIPMQGNNSSMNIATACSIAAYRLLHK